MFRVISRSAAYDPDCWWTLLAAAPVSGSTIILMLVAALLFLGVIPAPILLWFLLGLIFAAVCLRLTSPAQFHGASQASGSFALSLLTGAPRSETASLLLLPPSHSGLLHLAMLDRDWLSAGGNLLFGSSSKSNRLTDQDLSLLTTHLHDVNCQHCNINNTCCHTQPQAGLRGPGLLTALPPSPLLPLPAAHSAAAAAAVSVAASQHAGGHSMSHLLQPQQQQQQSRRAGALARPGQWSSSMVGLSSAGTTGTPAPTAAWGFAPGAGSGGGVGPGQPFDDIAIFFQGGQGVAAAAIAAGLNSTAATAAARQNQFHNAGNSSSSSSSSSSSNALLQLPPAWSAHAGPAATEVAALPDPHFGSSGGGSTSSSSSSSQPQRLPVFYAASSNNAGSVGGSTSQGSIGGSWPRNGLATSCGGAAAGTPAAAPAAAAAAAAAAAVPAGPYLAAGHWPSTAASSAGLAALSAHQTALSQSAFHQSLLRAWGSYSSLDGLDDSSSSVCSICLASYKPGVLITTLPCAHMYHKGCVMPWLLQQGRQATCPMCKAEVFV